MSVCSVSPNPEVARLVERTGYACAALTLLPIPGSEILGVMPLHVGMVVGIGHHYGRELTRESAMELVLQIATTVGLSLVGSRLAVTAAKIVLPGLGGIIAAPFLFASTLGLGAVADAWFRSGGGLGEAEMRDLYASATRDGRSEFRSDRARDANAKDAAAQAADLGERLKRAQEMHQQGLLDDQEYAAARARILGAL